jgi:GT2 family glycosyltransferase
MKNSHDENEIALPKNDIDVIIVSWNTKDMLRDCLESVTHSQEPVTKNIWVVDNASSDGSAAMVTELFPHVKLIQNEANSGFAVANNQVLRIANGRYHLLLNSDTIVPPNTLPALVAVMDANPDTAVCSPLLLNADGSPQWCWAKFPNARSEWSGTLDRTQSPYPLTDFSDSQKRTAMKPFPVDWVGGACFLVRADAEKVGLLDESYFMYSEETDWCRRFQQAGYKTLLVPSVTVTHLGGGSSRAVPKTTRQRMYRSSLRFYRTHYGIFGSILPASVATARYLLSPLRRNRSLQNSPKKAALM